MENRLIVYGSLRKGAYNFQRFVDYYSEENIRYEKTLVIEGYLLYDLGYGYPCAIQTGNPDHKITVDILNVSDLCFEALNAMEIGAGYKPTVIEVDNEKAIIYVFKRPEGTLVPEGDWLSHINN